jgi:5-methyltetrahydropteroyltriglutamate--homocysteine methyltransferase
MTLRSPGLYLASAGGYPRFGETHEVSMLRQTMEALANGDRTSADLLDAQNDTTRLAIADQVQAGLDIITDGRIRWDDPISHIPSKLDNVRIDEQLPYLNTGRYFRQPVLTDKILRRGMLIADEYSFARNALGQIPTPPAKAGKLSIKPVLTGPYTLAKLSLTEGAGKNGHARDTSAHLEDRAAQFADVLAVEVEALVRGGAQLIQLDEPAILSNPQDWKVFEAALRPLIDARDKARQSGRTIELALHTYFEDGANLYEKLVELPVDILGLDMVSAPKMAATIISAGSTKPLALGVLSSTSTDAEDCEALAKVIEKVLPRIEGGRAYLSPASGLEFLSRTEATAKLKSLVRIQALLNG